MKTINIKKGVAKNMIGLNLDITDRQPCWQVTLSNSGDRTKAKWIVEVKALDDQDKYTLKIADLGDVKDEAFWATTTSVDFAVRLLDEYRSGNIDSWVNGGCRL